MSSSAISAFPNPTKPAGIPAECVGSFLVEAVGPLLGDAVPLILLLCG